MERTKEQLIADVTKIRSWVVDPTPEGRAERLEKAATLCDSLLRDYPDHPDFLSARGFIDFEKGLLSEAETWMKRAILFAPKASAILYNYGVILLARKKYNEALSVMERVATLNPTHSKALYEIGNILKETGHADGALDAFDKALNVDPTYADCWNNKGNLLKEVGQLDDALICYDQALKNRPDFFFALNNMGVAHLLKNDPDTAEIFYQKALSLKPDYAEALSNLAVICRLRGDSDRAIALCQKALTLTPAYAGALNNLGNAFKDVGRLTESLTSHRQALALEPDNPEFHSNYAMALLLSGHLEEGWREQEWRWKTKQLSSTSRFFEQPQWRGEDGEGQTIYVYSEQGFGDTLQFCRYIPLIAQRGFHVVVETPGPLHRLMQTVEGVETIVSSSLDCLSFDVQCPMMSLPLAFTTTLETIPAPIPYLHPYPEDILKWRTRLASIDKNKLKVGLVWAGGLRAHSPDLVAADRKRSLSPALLEPLMHQKNVQFFSLQKDGQRAPDEYGIIDWMDDCHDFADTAAFIENLDLVISVDTSVAHLAGALGKPVWLLNRFNTCWRWLENREDSPWYPSLRLFRQTTPGAWPDVILRVRDALAQTPKALNASP